MTNQIIISDITIHKDVPGRYSLNNLLKATGGEDKIKPVRGKSATEKQNTSFHTITTRQMKTGVKSCLNCLQYSQPMGNQRDAHKSVGFA